jgi:hypothetical protein
MPRRLVNLGRLLLWWQNLIAIAVIAAVFALAWWAGRDRPIPLWIGDKLIPALGWIAIALAVFGLATRFLARRK